MAKLLAYHGVNMAGLPLPPIPLGRLNGELEYDDVRYESKLIVIDYGAFEETADVSWKFTGSFTYRNDETVEEEEEVPDEFEGDVGIDVPDAVSGMITGFEYREGVIDYESHTGETMTVAAFGISGMALDVMKYIQVAGSSDVFYPQGGHRLASLIFKGADQITGSDQHDNLLGYGGKDVIDARGGDDFVSGGAGQDTMTGGLGRDTFVFNVALTRKNVDKITDFRHSKDTFSLENSFFKGLKPGELAEGRFTEITNPKWTKGVDKTDRILYDKKDGDLYYDRDGSKKKYDPVKFAEIKDKTYLEADDFLIV